MSGVRRVSAVHLSCAPPLLLVSAAGGPQRSGAGTRAGPLYGRASAEGEDPAGTPPPPTPPHVPPPPPPPHCRGLLWTARPPVRQTAPALGHFSCSALLLALLPPPQPPANSFSLASHLLPWVQVSTAGPMVGGGFPQPGQHQGLQGLGGVGRAGGPRDPAEGTTLSRA